MEQEGGEEDEGDLITPRQLSGGARGEGGGEGREEGDVVWPPHSFGHLLQLPFYASYLAPIITAAAEQPKRGRAVMRGRRESDVDPGGGAKGGPDVVGEERVGGRVGEVEDVDSEEEERGPANFNLVPMSVLDSLAPRPPPSSSSPPYRHGSLTASSPPDATRSIALPRSPRASPPTLLPSSAIPASSGRPLSLRRLADEGVQEEAVRDGPSLPVNTAVMMSDLSSLFPFHPSLSSAYAFSTSAFPPTSLTSPSLLALHFQRAAHRCNRHDLVQLWQLMGLVLRVELVGLSEDEEECRGWGGAAWGGGLVRRLMAQYWRRGDVETVGLIACLLSLLPAWKVQSRQLLLTLPSPRLDSPSPLPAMRAQLAPGLRPPQAVRSASALPSTSSSPTSAAMAQRSLHPPLSSSPAAASPGLWRAHTSSVDDRSPLSASSPMSSSSLPTSLFSPPSPLTSSSSFLNPPTSSPSHFPPNPSLPSPSSPSPITLPLPVDDLYKLAYADYLHRVGLIQQRATVLRCLSSAFVAAHGGMVELVMGWGTKEMRVDIDPICQRCGNAVAVVAGGGGGGGGGGVGGGVVVVVNPWTGQQVGGQVNGGSSVRCPRCNVFAVHCVVCSLSVRGLSSFCLVCGHGGHLAHVQEWFEGGEKECASGCGCYCKEHAQLISCA